MAPANGLPKKLGDEDTAPDTPGSSPRHADYVEGTNAKLFLPLSMSNSSQGTWLRALSAVMSMPQGNIQDLRLSCKHSCESVFAAGDTRRNGANEDDSVGYEQQDHAAVFDLSMDYSDDEVLLDWEQYSGTEYAQTQ